MVGRVTAPKDVHIVIPQIREGIALDGKGDFADVIELGVLRWGIIQDYPNGPKVITRVLTTGKAESQRRGVTMGADLGVRPLSAGREPTSQESRKDKEGVLLQSFQKLPPLPTPGF